MTTIFQNSDKNKDNNKDTTKNSNVGVTVATTNRIGIAIRKTTVAVLVQF